MQQTPLVVTFSLEKKNANYTEAAFSKFSRRAIKRNVEWFNNTDI